ncbi:NAD(P)H-hydrate dehydratase [Candidatus Falkowbacteria bacterium]|nr:NAD(P)H-hydrate dehydratase [Candidatus Falkowbacteria bacterium]
MPLNLKKIKKSLLDRKLTASKYDFGHVLVVGGSRGMVGAPLLAGMAALRSGAGLVTLAVPTNIETTVSKRVLDLMVTTFKKALNDFAPAAFPELKKFIVERRVSLLAIGSGLALTTNNQKFLAKIIKDIELPLVIDAGALRLLDIKSLATASHHKPIIITPHEGEMAKLLELTLSSVKQARQTAVDHATHDYGFEGVVILKGHETIIAQGGRRHINKTGNPAMAKAGMGDILTGMVAAFVAQGLPAFEAACLATELHGKAGDICAKESSPISVLASDLIEKIPAAIKK